MAHLKNRLVTFSGGETERDGKTRARAYGGSSPGAGHGSLSGLEEEAAPY